MPQTTADGVTSTILFDNRHLRIEHESWERGGQAWGTNRISAPAPQIVFARHPFVVSWALGRQWVSPSQVLFDNPSVEFRREAHLDDRVCTDTITFDAELLLESLSGLGGMRHRRAAECPFQAADAITPPHTFLEERRLIAYLQRTGPPDELLVEESAFRLLAACLATSGELDPVPAAPRRPETRRAHTRAVERVKEYIGCHLSEPLTIGELARVAGIAPIHFCLVFKRILGVTIHQYIGDLRLKAAVDVLPEWRGRLSALSLRLGFSSASHFTYAFRRRFGLPPSQLTEELNGPEAPTHTRRAGSPCCAMPRTRCDLSTER